MRAFRRRMTVSKDSESWIEQSYSGALVPLFLARQPLADEQRSTARRNARSAAAWHVRATVRTCHPGGSR